jgi:hypothetical protein
MIEYSLAYSYACNSGNSAYLKGFAGAGGDGIGIGHGREIAAGLLP